MLTKIVLISISAGTLWGLLVWRFSDGTNYGKQLGWTLIAGSFGWIAASVTVWIMGGWKLAACCWLTPAFAIFIGMVIPSMLPDRKEKETTSDEEAEIRRRYGDLHTQ